MKIKVVALDIYGTVLAFDDCDDSFQPRKGLADFLDACDRRGIMVVTSSDAFTGNVKNDLEIAFKLAAEVFSETRLRLERFDGFFQLNQGPKDFSVIIEHYRIAPEELLVIGDNIDKDFNGALMVGATAILCPKFGIAQGKDWDFAKIDLDEIGRP